MKNTDKMSKVALIYPYFRTYSSNEMLFPPLGIAALTSRLFILGLEVKIFDCTFSSFEEVRESIRSFNPGITGIYSMVSMSRNTFRIAKMVRTEFPECVLVAGGPLPTLYPENYSNRFDMVFRGEADLDFPRFCRDFFAMNTTRQSLAALPLETYKGLFIKTNGLTIDNPAVHLAEKEIGSLPLPYREGFDHAAYQDVWHGNDGSKTTSLITSFGCPFKCDFCSKPVFGDVLRRRNLDRVFEEIGQIRRLGYDSLWIADDNFTLDMSYLREFCHRIMGRGIAWSCLSRVTGLDRATTLLMKEAGCRRVYLGLESGSEATLRLMKKRATLEDGIQAVNLFRDAGIETAAFFIVGYPGETVSSIESTFRFASELPLAYVSFNIPFPLPGSALFERVGTFDKTKDWDSENEVSFIYNSEFDPVYLRHRIEQTMMEVLEKKKTAVAVLS